MYSVLYMEVYSISVQYSYSSYLGVLDIGLVIVVFSLAFDGGTTATTGKRATLLFAYMNREMIYGVKGI